MRSRSSILVITTVAWLTGDAYAQSIPDGALVRYAGNPLLTKGSSGSYDQLKIGPRAIQREAPNVWRMWYEAVPGGNQATTAYATSSDGFNWTKYAGNPVMSPSEPWEGTGGTNQRVSSDVAGVISATGTDARGAGMSDKLATETRSRGPCAVTVKRSPS